MKETTVAASKKVERDKDIEFQAPNERRRVMDKKDKDKLKGIDRQDQENTRDKEKTKRHE